MGNSWKSSEPPEPVDGKTLTPILSGVMSPTRSSFKHSKSAYLAAESRRSINPNFASQQLAKMLNRNRNVIICAPILYSIITFCMHMSTKLDPLRTRLPSDCSDDLPRVVPYIARSSKDFSWKTHALFILKHEDVGDF